MSLLERGPGGERPLSEARRESQQRGQGRVGEDGVGSEAPDVGSRKKKRPVRIQDYLEPTTSKIKEKKFAVYDIESKSGDSRTEAGFDRPFLAQAFDPYTGATSGPLRDEPHLRNRDWRTRHVLPGGCIDKLANYLLSEQFAGYVFYAHNGGSFDHLFLLHWLQQRREEYGFEIIPVQSSIQVLRVWRWPEDPEATITETWDFLDSMKLLPMSLAKACETFNVDTKIDHDLHRHEDDPSWEEYLFQDCKALALVMLAFYEMIQVRLASEVGITTPSTSMKLFRRHYLGKHGTPERIARYQHWPECKLRGTAKNPGPCTGCAHAWIRSGYYGGRTEIFRLFGLGLHYYDINSSYVAAMHQDMPIGQRVIEHGKLTWSRHRNVDNPRGLFGGFCECTVYIPPECPFPPLPHKDTETGKLRFPTGRFHGVWNVDELKLLEDPLVNGRIEYVVCTVWFRLQKCFSEMVTNLWAFRNPKLPGYDGGMAALAKLLGNGIYGKFAMKPQRTSVVFTRVDRTPEDERCFLCDEPALSKGSVCKGCEGSKAAMDAEDGDVWYQAKEVDAPYIIPHISAHITTLARIALWRYMRMAIRTPAVGRDLAEGLAVGETVFPGDADAPLAAHEGPIGLEEVHSPEMVVRAVVHPDDVEITLRDLDTGKERILFVDRGVRVRAGGKVYYSDTDSILCDVALPWDAGVMGALKDEYPGELLNFLAVQPKVYLIEKQGHNARVAEAAALLAKAEAGKLPAAEAEAVRARRAAALADVERVKQQETYRSPAWWAVKKKEEKKLDYWALDPIGLKPFEKVTMKGFPKNKRTKANLEILRGGPIDWEALAKGTMPPMGDKGTLDWPALERIRSLAREGFRRPPRMKQGSLAELEKARTAAEAAGDAGEVARLGAEIERLAKEPRRYHAVSKSFQGVYDKRHVVADGTGRTVSVVLDGSNGGVDEGWWEKAWAAE